MADELCFDFGDRIECAQLFPSGCDVVVMLVAECGILGTESHELVADYKDADVEYEGHNEEGLWLSLLLPYFQSLPPDSTFDYPVEGAYEDVQSENEEKKVIQREVVGTVHE